jgi:hypothetical protein
VDHILTRDVMFFVLFQVHMQKAVAVFVVLEVSGEEQGRSRRREAAGVAVGRQSSARAAAATGIHIPELLPP